MNRSVRIVEPDSVDCEVCLQLVQHSRAEMEEVNDYVMYFCGLECCARWREGQSTEPQE